MTSAIKRKIKINVQHFTNKFKALEIELENINNYRMQQVWGALALCLDLILFIDNTISLCPCLTFRVSELPAVIFSAT